MKSWELDFKWLEIKHYVKESVGLEKLPDFYSILLLIGIQELGRIQHNYSREEKQDLMHIATCILLAQDGYYLYTGQDDDGWPHFKNLKPLEIEGDIQKNTLLKEKIIQYFASSIKNHE